MSLESDAFAVGQRQQPVVVHHRVHVLDPQRVHVAVEHQVLALVLLGRSVDVAEDARQQAVGPVARVGVEHAVQLHHAPVLRVDRVQLRRQRQPVKR